MTRALKTALLLSLLAHAVLLSFLVPRMLQERGASEARSLQARLNRAERQSAGLMGRERVAPERVLAVPLKEDASVLRPSESVRSEPRTDVPRVARSEEVPLAVSRSEPLPVEVPPPSSGDVRAYRLSLGGAVKRLRREYEERFARSELDSRRGLAGRVELLLQMSALGGATLSVSKSSGSPALDAEARDLHWRAVQAAELPAGLRNRAFAIPLVMEFVLED